VQECPLKYYLSYAVAKDFPFLDELNNIFTRSQEAGLLDKWKLDIQKLETKYYTPLIANTPNTLKAYSMNDLWFAFIFLFVGYLMSTIILIFELIFEKLKKRLSIFLRNCFT